MQPLFFFNYAYFEYEAVILYKWFMWFRITLYCGNLKVNLSARVSKAIKLICKTDQKRVIRTLVKAIKMPKISALSVLFLAISDTLFQKCTRPTPWFLYLDGTPPPISTFQGEYEFSDLVHLCALNLGRLGLSVIWFSSIVMFVSFIEHRQSH